ncbi:hypothetical protein ACWF62_17805 [Rhodococcus sp. NPDC054953]
MGFPERFRDGWRQAKATQELARLVLEERLAERAALLGDQLGDGEELLASSAGLLTFEKPGDGRSMAGLIDEYVQEPEGDFVLTGSALYYVVPEGRVLRISLRDVQDVQIHRSPSHPRLRNVWITAGNGDVCIAEVGVVFAKQVRKARRNAPA